MESSCIINSELTHKPGLSRRDANARCALLPTPPVFAINPRRECAADAQQTQAIAFANPVENSQTQRRG